MKIVLLPQAKEDLDRIYDPVWTKVASRLRILKDYPMMGVAMSGPVSGYRMTIVDFFRIVYQIRDEETVEVAYIRDCRRSGSKSNN